MKWVQKQISLSPKKRGFHLVTSEIEDQIAELGAFKVGLAHIFVRHTSASLTINENADPTVRSDFESHFDKMVPENAPYYAHTIEGPDDMPAHIKAALLGNGLLIPITHGRFNLGTWQGIYLCEHRNHPRARSLTVTLFGDSG
jgi:secondary thiamine-phosphate synthase enzyme